MTARELTINSRYDDVAIPAIVTSTPAPSRVVLLVHGLTGDKDEHLNLYGRLATELARRNIATVRFDLRAHGDSAAPSTSLTIVTNTLDTLSVARWAREAWGLPIHLHGTSFGGPPSVLAVAAAPEWFQRLTLLAPALDLQQLYTSPSDPRRARYTDLRRQALLQAAPLVVDDRRAFGAAIALEFVVLDIPRLLGAIEVPRLVVHGTHDSVIPYEHSVRICEDANVPLVTLEGMDHLLTPPGDELGASPESHRYFSELLDVLLGQG